MGGCEQVFGVTVFAAPAPAPGPIFGAFDEAGPNGIRQDVRDGVRQVLLGVDHPRAEALAEERALAVVASVVLPRVVALEPLNGSRELFGGAFQNRVVVRVHEAVRVQPQPETRHGGQEEQQEQPSIPVRAEEHGLVHGICGDVEVAVREVSAANSRHAANGTAGSGSDGRSPLFRPTSGTASWAGTSVRHSSRLEGASPLSAR